MDSGTSEGRVSASWILKMKAKDCNAFVFLQLCAEGTIFFLFGGTCERSLCKIAFGNFCSSGFIIMAAVKRENG